MEVALEDTLVRKNSMSLRKKNIDSMLQETKIDMNTCKPGTGTAGPEIVESECEESSSGSTVTIESPLTAKLEPSVYYDKVQGSRANLCLANGGGEIENENTDLIKDKTMPIPLERKTRMPEKSISTGNVEEIVRVLTEQQSHDILCPVCGSCITERVILRKRKRTSQGFVDKRPKGNVSSEVDSTQGSGYQNDQQQAPTEVKEEIYGCLSCLSFFIRRVEECFSTGNRDINTLTTNMPLPAGTNKQDILTAVIKGDKIENELGKHDGLPDNYKNGSSEDSNESNKGSHLCNCIPVSIQSILSAWSSKQILKDGQLREPLLGKKPLSEGPTPADGQLREPLLGEKPLDEGPPPADGQLREPLLGKKPLDEGPPPADGQLREPLLGKKPLDEGPPPADGQLREPLLGKKPLDEGPPPADGHSTIINVHPNVKPGGVPTEPITDHVVQWDILKSIVYGGLNVSLTSFGVVSTAAGGEAKTLTVIAIGLANMVTGLFMLCNSIMDPQNREAIGQNWFNRYVALVSYLFLGCLAPITYGFSFQKSDDRNYKFLTTSAVALVSIVLLALGKAHVNRPNTLRHYSATVSLYVVGGFWVSIIGYLCGEYISKLLHNWGFKTDHRNTDGPLYY